MKTRKNKTIGNATGWLLVLAFNLCTKTPSFVTQAINLALAAF